MAVAKVLEPLQTGIQLSCGMIVLTYFVSGIWNSIWVSFINNDLYLLLADGMKLRNEVLSTAGLGWGTIVLALVFVIFVYFFGYAFWLHGIMALLALTAAVSELVLLGLTARHVDGPHRATIRNSFTALIDAAQSQVVRDWARENQCTSSISCSDAIDKYLLKRNLVGFGFNIAILILFAFGFFGVIIVLSLMASVKPVARDVSEAPPISTHTLADEASAEQPQASKEANAVL